MVITIPLAILEVFTPGLPVVAIDIGGIKELLEGVEGCFRLPLEAEAWARLFAQLSANPQPLSMFTSPELRQFMAIANELAYFYE